MINKRLKAFVSILLSLAVVPLTLLFFLTQKGFTTNKIAQSPPPGDATCYFAGPPLKTPQETIEDLQNQEKSLEELHNNNKIDETTYQTRKKYLQEQMVIFKKLKEEQKQNKTQPR